VRREIIEAQERVERAWEDYQRAERELEALFDAVDADDDDAPHEHDCAVNDETGESCDCRGESWGSGLNYERNAGTCVGGEGE